MGDLAVINVTAGMVSPIRQSEDAENFSQGQKPFEERLNLTLAGAKP
jgi:hypothetical protein